MNINSPSSFSSGVSQTWWNLTIGFSVELGQADSVGRVWVYLSG